MKIEKSYKWGALFMVVFCSFLAGNAFAKNEFINASIVGFFAVIASALVGAVFTDCDKQEELQ